jgi:copper/silver efflux system protein
VYPLYNAIGSEFMPPLYEGTIMYMPVTVPGIGITEAGRLLGQQDRILRAIPEVARVFGKVGRAETSTDPAPLSMVETIITLKPADQWRPGMTHDKLIAHMDSAVAMPGVQNAWTLPIRGRIDMLTTGIRTPLGIKIGGASLDTIQRIGTQIENLLLRVDGTQSVYAERVTGGFYLDIDIKRDRIARYGLTISDVQEVIQASLGGAMAGRTVEGRERYSIVVRYKRELRDNVEMIRRVLVPIPGNPLRHVPLEEIAEIRMSSGPGMIRDENGLLTGYVFIDVTRDLGSYVEEARAMLDHGLRIPAGYSLAWSGQHEFQERASARLRIIVPLVILIVFVLLYMTFRSVTLASVILASVAYAVTGGVVLQYLLGYNFSVAVWVGYIAVFGIAVETGIVMVVYLQEALERHSSDDVFTSANLHEAVIEGSVKRLRPKLMTVATTIIGLLPILWSTGVGADVMKPIATPIVGGMVTSTVFVLVIIPVIFYLLNRGKARG